MIIREQSNLAEQFQCVKIDDYYVCTYIDCGQIQHSCKFSMTKSELESLLKTRISENCHEIIVNRDVFEKLMTCIM